MEIGKKIKHLRTEKGITQEKLAEYLNVSFQAVSKWENSTATPDISLLPKISTYFGITIDDLFTLSDQAHLQRIENMLENERTLTHQDENYVKYYLTDLLDHHESQGKAHSLLSKLYNHRAASYHEQAYLHAKKALKFDPTNKENHVALVEAGRGVFTDWNYVNHHKLCDFYTDFCNEHADNWSAHLYLLDHLIADGRLNEAREVVIKLASIKDGYLVYLYNGKIAKASGNHQQAFAYWETMVKDYADNWLAWLTMADELSYIGEYDKAISYYQKAMEIQPKPRYYDGYESMAHIYEIQSKYNNASIMWDKIISLLEDEWSISFGEMLDKPRREALRLRQLSEITSH